MKKGERKGCVLFMLLIIFILFLSCSFFVSAQQGQEKTKIKKAYSWLKSRSIGRWQNLDTEQHVFSLLALMDEISELQKKASVRILIDKSFENGTCWPEIACKGKETAMAKLALDAADSNTEKADEWLLNRTSVPSGIDWYLQLIQPAEQPSRCLLFYEGQCANGCEIAIDKEGVVSGNYGNCFTSTAYWLNLNPECADRTFNVTCNTSIAANFLFKKGADWYVTGQLEHAQPQESLSISLTSLCIETFNVCDYEATLWTAYAFFKQGRIDTSRTFLPYLIMFYEDNLQHMPQAFLYELTKRQSFASELAALQRTDGLWQAQGSFNKYYDTALVALMTHSLVGNITKTKKTLLEEQKIDGSWQCSGCDNIRDTALILLGLWPVFEYYSECQLAGYSCVINCTESNGTLQNYYCFENYECCDLTLDCEDKYGKCKDSCADNETEVSYVCEPGLKCCKPYDKSMCRTEIGGQICSSGQKCLNAQGQMIAFITSADSAYCCLGTCKTASLTCSEAGGEYCNPAEGESCQNNRWLQAIDTDYCCELGYCVKHSLSCEAMGGDICASDEDCKDGVLVEAANTGGQATCCTQGGKCILKNCDGTECKADESCVDGTMIETSEVLRCCVGGQCLKSCLAQGGTECSATMICDGWLVNASDTNRCCMGKCKKPSVFPWLTLIIIFVILALAIIIFLFVRKKRKPKVPARLEFPGLRMPPRLPPRRMPARARVPVKVPPKPTAKPKLPPVPKPS